jgi:hypothetical protein
MQQHVLICLHLNTPQLCGKCFDLPASKYTTALWQMSQEGPKQGLVGFINHLTNTVPAR